MRKIGIREFLRNINEQTKDLPILVTKTGKPWFVVSTVNGGLPETEDLKQLAKANKRTREVVVKYLKPMVELYKKLNSEEFYKEQCELPEVKHE